MKLEELHNALNESETELETPNKVETPDGETCNTAQAAKILNVSMARIRQYKAEGKLKPVQSPEPGSRDNIFKTSDIYKLKGEQGDDGELKRTGRPAEIKNKASRDKKDD